SRHTNIRKISETVRPSRRATSLLVSPAGSLAKSSRMSRPFSRAGVGYRLAALVFFPRIYAFTLPSVQRPLKPENQISKSSACANIDRVYRKHFLEEKSRRFNSCAIAASKLLGAAIGGHTGK